MGAADTAHLHVAFDKAVYVGALRYFESTGCFASSVQSTLMTTLPSTLKAKMASAEDGEALVALAWRSPTETILLTDVGSLFENIGRLPVSDPDGCFVDQTHGHCVLRASGKHLLDLFSRLGGGDLFPLLGESKRGRLADVPVLALKVQKKETLLVVERTYMEHLMDWIQETALDLTILAVPFQ
jgi:sarcosine oxidase gamma subunit